MRAMKRKLMVVVVLIGLFIVGTSQIALADKWQPYRFKGNERFEYKVIWAEDEEKTEGTYILDTKKSGANILGGTYIAKGTLTKEEGATGYGISLVDFLLSPGSVFLSFQVDLQVGKQVRFHSLGGMIIKVIGKEKIAGREGFVCQLFQAEGGKEELVAEWTIDPKLPMPLRSKVFEGTGAQGQMELIKYTRY